MSDETVIYEMREDVVFITMNRPQKLNALNKQMSHALHAAWNRFQDDPAAKVAIFRANGTSFCAGADVTSDKGEDPDDNGMPWNVQIHQAYPHNGTSIFKPIIGCVQGYALGAGFRLAVQGCDITIAGESALLGYPESKAGIPIVPMAYVPLMPFKVSLEFALLAWKGGRLLSGKRAFDLGIVNQVVPDAELEAEALRWAELLKEIPPLYIKSVKYGHYKAIDTPKAQAERDYVDFVWPQEASEDRREARAAFREKRKPVFKGK